MPEAIQEGPARPANLGRYFVSSEYLCRNSGLYTLLEPSTMNRMEREYEN